MDIKKEHEQKANTSSSYKEWWEENKERILEEDRLNHEMNFKHAASKNMDELYDEATDI